MCIFQIWVINSILNGIETFKSNPPSITTLESILQATCLRRWQFLSGAFFPRATVSFLLLSMLLLPAQYILLCVVNYFVSFKSSRALSPV